MAPPPWLGLSGAMGRPLVKTAGLVPYASPEGGTAVTVTVTAAVLLPAAVVAVRV